MKTTKCYKCYESKSCYHMVEVIPAQVPVMRLITDVSSPIGDMYPVCPSCAREMARASIQIVSMQWDKQTVSLCGT